MSVDARVLALDVLLQVAAGGPSDRSLDRVLRRVDPPARDRALVTELVYGVLRRRQSLDAIIAPHSRRPLDELDAPVIGALRLGVYQFVYLDTVPHHAAVDTVVRAVKERVRGAAGFVNAVLRSILRGPEEARRGPTGTLAERTDVPQWLADRWTARFGEERAQAWFAAALEPSPMTLRPHRRIVETATLVEELAREGVVVEAATHAPGALTVISGNPVGSRLLATGAFSVRGEGSQLVTSLLAPQPGDRLLDACAGRGGKTVQIAEDSDGVVVVASDISSWRIADNRRQAAAAAAPGISHVVADLSSPAPFAPLFSSVLVDAPCSGLGTVRRHPELKWRNDPARISDLADLQGRILENAADVLVAGGSLLYVTCSTEPEENEQVVARLLRTRNDLSLAPVLLPDGADRRLVGTDGCFRTFPDFVDMDGFFASRLVKTA